MRQAKHDKSSGAMEAAGAIKIFTQSVEKNNLIYRDYQGWISDIGIDGPTFVPKSGYFLLIWVKVCPQKLAFS